MPLGLAFGFAMVGVIFEDLLRYEYYSYAGNLRGSLQTCELRDFSLLRQIEHVFLQT